MSKASESAYMRQDKYIARMEEIGKTPSCLRMYSSDYDACLAAYNKDRPEKDKVDKLRYRGFDVVRVEKRG